jgi:hypothetical protein
MKHPAFQAITKCVAFVLPCTVCVIAYADGGTNAARRIAPPALVKSVFVDDVRGGVDPFFPKSTRRNERIEQQIVTNASPEPGSLLNNLVLKGLSGVKGSQYALINSATIAAGETAEVRYGRGQILTIRVREIRDRSVIVELVGTGATKELKLRDNI